MNAIEMFRALEKAIDSLDVGVGDFNVHRNTIKECIKGLGIAPDDRIKEVYEYTFTEDELGSEINKTLTFRQLIAAMSKGSDFYALIGVGDSIIRTRVFRLLVGAYNNIGIPMDYDDIYDLWIHKGDVA